MIIKDLRVEEADGLVEVSADIDGFRLWFRTPSEYSLSTAADPFFAAALFPAMSEGGSLEVHPDLAVSPVLLDNARVLQEIFSTWNPILKVVPVTARTSPAPASNDGALAFFSGGVDSLYTLLKHREEISHAVFILGFDFPEAHRRAYDQALARNTAFVESLGKRMIPIETNLHPFGYRYHMSRNLTQGCHLGAVALALGFPLAYVPASVSYGQLYPLGSHPLTDPRWSNGAVQIVHDGAEARRVDKLQSICESEESEAALSNLQVCFDNLNINCGRCAKCLRTMVPLALLGHTSPAFPPLPPLKSLRRSIRGLGGEIEMMFAAESAELAARRDGGPNRALGKIMEERIRRAELRRGVALMDQALFGGGLKRTARRLAHVRARGESLFYIDTTPHD